MPLLRTTAMRAGAAVIVAVGASQSWAVQAAVPPSRSPSLLPAIAPASATAARIQTDITAPKVPVAPRAVSATATRRVTLTWGSATGSDVASFDVRTRSMGLTGVPGAYRALRSGVVAPNLVTSGTPGTTLCASVRARDRAGNTSSWSPDGCAATAIDDRSLQARKFLKVRDRAAYEGTLSRATARGATLRSARVVARSISVIVRTCRSCGTAVVKWNGKAVRTVRTSGRAGTAVVPVSSFIRPTSGVLSIAVSSRKGAVTVDGVAISNASITGSIVLGGGRGWSSSRTVTVTPVAPGAARWRVAADGSTYGAWRALGAADLQLRDLDGTRTVTAQFQDAAGNLSPASTASVVLDRVAPTVTPTSSSASIEAGASTTVSATVADSSPLQSVRASTVLIDPPNTLGAVELLPAGDTFAATINPTAPLYYRVVATDVAGNATTTPQAPDPPLAVEVAVAPTVQERIGADLEAGRITYATSLLYRLYILFADPRLPTSYEGAASSGEDASLFTELTTAYPDLSPAEQAIADTYLARPDDPGSVFGQPLRAAAERAVGSAAAGGPPPSAARDCGAGWAFTNGTHVRVHSCEVDSTERVKIRDIVEGLWTSMTAAPPAGMGPPVSDGIDNGGSDLDGRLDVYLLDGTDCILRAGTCEAIPGNAVAMTVPAGPKMISGPRRTQAAFMVLSKSRAAATTIKADIAHEFFHILQFAHNVNAVFAATGSSPNAAGTPVPRTVSSWFAESSAEWAVWRYARNEGRSELYLEYTAFQRHPKPLITHGLTGDPAPYNAWVWPQFMTEKTDSAVFDAWVGSHAVADPVAFDAVISAQRSITTDFRDFAVRNVNRDLLGAPFATWASKPDSAGFPTDIPAVRSLTNSYELSQTTAPQRVDVAGVSAQYDAVGVPRAVSGLVQLDFSSLTNVGNLDVDLLLRKRAGGEWKRAKVEGGRYEFCTLQTDQDFDKVLIVLSNHSFARKANGGPDADLPDPAKRVSGQYTTSVSTCAALSGTIGYQFNHDGLYLDGTSTLGESGIINVSMEQPFLPGGPVPFAFVDDGRSTWEVSHSEMIESQQGDCTVTTQITAAAAGRFGGPLQSIALVAYDPADPFAPGVAASLLIDLRLEHTAVVSRTGPSCGDPETTTYTASVAVGIKCVAPGAQSGARPGGYQFTGVRKPATGAVTGYDFSCTGSTRRDPLSPMGTMSVTGRVTLATPQ